MNLTKRRTEIKTVAMAIGSVVAATTLDASTTEEFLVGALAQLVFCRAFEQRLVDTLGNAVKSAGPASAPIAKELDDLANEVAAELVAGMRAKAKQRGDS